MVDVLALQERELREIVFLGQPLGAAGAAVAMRQARQLRLDVPENTSFHGRVFKLFIRADVIEEAGTVRPVPTHATFVVRFL